MRTLPLPASLRTLSVGALLAFATFCIAAADEPKPPAPSAPQPATAPKPARSGKDVGHMHNVQQVTPRFFRGSQPVTEDDFAELARLGVKVVVSVDGATPDLASAHKHGLRYVHVPMGYDGPTRAEQVLLYKAFTTLSGPFYVHCHHGRHRGPAACGIGLLAVESWTPQQVLAEYERAGVAARYEGLYALPGKFVVPTAEELAAAPAELPEVAPVLPLTGAMVLIDQTWERLGAVRKAKWLVPPDHPDLAPTHEATIFAERWRELARTDEVKAAHADLLRRTQASEGAAWDLARALGTSPVDAAKAEEAYLCLERACAACHEQFRDTPAGATSR